MRFLLLILLFTLSITRLTGQQRQLQFDQITIDDGLSSSSITCIYQDHKGYLWIGTFDGLNRYDGHNFEVFKNNPADRTSISHNLISSIREDRDHNLLIGTSNGLSLYDWGKDHFFNYMLEESSPLYGLSCIVRNIVLDSLDNLWLSTNIGLIYYDRQHGTCVHYTHNSGNDASISSNEIECTYIENTDNIWVTTRSGLNLFHPSTGNFEHIVSYSNQKHDISDTYFLGIISDKEGTLWFGSYEGLFCLEKDGNFVQLDELSLIRYSYDPADPFSLSDNRVLSMYVDKQGSLWIGTENGGLNLFDKVNKKFYRYRFDPYNPKCLKNESVKAINQDKTGNLWIGTFAGGLHLATVNSGAFLLYTNLPGAPESLSHNVVTGFLEDNRGNIWIGTDGGGLNLFNRKTGKFQSLTDKNSNLNSNAILSMIEDSKNRIWLGTWAGGLNLFNCETRTFRTFTTKNSDIPENDIFAVAEGNHNDLWLGGMQSGLTHFEIEKNKFTNYSPANSNISNPMVSVIRKDNKGNLYVGTPYGLNVLNYGTDSFITYLPGSSGLNQTSILDILVQNDTTIWIGTQGLYLFNPEKGTFIQAFEDNEMENSTIKGLALDNKGILWITTNRGICRYDYVKGKYKIFTKSDGLQSNEFNYRSIFKLNDGSLLAGGTKGFNLIFPDKVTENRHIPNIVLTDFQIFNEDVPVGIDGSPLTRHISETSEIVLSYSQSVLTFSFSAMDFTMPEKNQYAYKMEGFDDRWHEVGNKREATYTNLDPGVYTFRAKGSNNDGIWNNTGISLKIIIRPPWWKTKLFRTSTLILLIGLIISFYYYRVTQLKNQKARLERMVNERTREIAEKNEVLHKQTNELNEINAILEERQQRIEEQTEELKSQAEELSSTNKRLITLNATKDKFFSIIAHDLKNPFTSIMGFCEILLIRYQKYDDTKRLHLIKIINQSAEHVFKLLENLLQWSRSQTGNIKYQPEEFQIIELVNNNVVLIENMMKEKQLRMDVVVNEHCKVYADKNMINTIIRNLLTNAVKFTETGGIHITLEEDTKLYKLKIKDTGVGMNKEKAKTLFEIGGSKSTEGTRGESGTGLGLIICKDFIEKNGGEIGVESEEGKGSEFYFTLPRSNNA